MVMIVLSGEETLQAFSWESAIAAIREAYAAAPAPRRSGRVVAAADGNSIRTMVAVSVGALFGSKQLVRAPDGLRYVISLFDRADARLAYLVDGIHVTAVRTAATSAVALDLLADNKPMDLAVLGSSVEARHHLEAAAQVRPLKSVRVFSPSDQSRAAFVAWARESLGLEVRAMASAADAVAGASCVIAAARAHGEQPILYGEWLDCVEVVISIGSTLPHQRELDVSVLERANVVISDEPEELLHETGDLLVARDRGIDVSGRLFSLSALVRGELSDRLVQGSGLRLYKSIGSAVQDVAVAEAVARRCAALGLGTAYPINFLSKH